MVIVNPPLYLRLLDQWIVWKKVWIEGEGKPRKVPFNPRTGKKCDITNPRNWATYKVALKALSRGYEGLGIVLAPPLVGIDIDGYCRDEDEGTVDSWAMDIVREVDSYTEASPSGTGLHILASGYLPPLGRRSDGIEFYCEDRFLTFTGNHIEGTPMSIEDRWLPIIRLHQRLFPVVIATALPRTKLKDRDDADLVLKASASFPKFARLYGGDWKSEYTSHSEADLACCSYLALYTADRNQIDRIIRSSGLYRDKWERTDYRSSVLKKVLDGVVVGGGYVERILFPLQQTLLDKYGVKPEVSPLEWVTYAARYRFETGQLDLPSVSYVPLSDEVRPAIKKVYEGFILRLRCFHLERPGEPIMYSRRFARDWTGVAIRHAHFAITWLVDNGYMKVADMQVQSHFHGTPLYLPGDGSPRTPRRGSFLGQ